MTDQQFSQFIAASPGEVYRALLNPALVAQWRVPSDMHAVVHAFDARNGGEFRVSLTYELEGPTGKTSARSDTYRGTFRELVRDRRVVEVMEFETNDPQMQGAMVITTTLDAVDGGTLLTARHAGLPPGISASDNEVGWRDSLARLAGLFEQASA